MIKTTLYLPDNLHKKIKVFSAQNKISMTEILVDALNNYLEETVKPLTKKDVLKIAGATTHTKGITLTETNLEKSGLTKKRGEMDTDNYT